MLAPAPAADRHPLAIDAARTDAPARSGVLRKDMTLRKAAPIPRRHRPNRRGNKRCATHDKNQPTCSTLGYLVIPDGQLSDHGQWNTIAHRRALGKSAIFSAMSLALSPRSFKTCCWRRSFCPTRASRLSRFQPDLTDFSDPNDVGERAAGNGLAARGKATTNASWLRRTATTLPGTKATAFTMEPLLGRDILFFARRSARAWQRGRAPAATPAADSGVSAAPRRTVSTGDGADHGASFGPAAAWDGGRSGGDGRQVTFHIVASLLFGMPADDISLLLHDFEDVGLGLFSLVHLRIPGCRFIAPTVRDGNWLTTCGKNPGVPTKADAGPDVFSQLLDAEGEDGERLFRRNAGVGNAGVLFAGCDTTASMLTSILVALADHPEVRTRVQHELATVDVEQIRAACCLSFRILTRCF